MSTVPTPSPPTHPSPWERALATNSYIVYGDAQGCILREYPGSGKIYEVATVAGIMTLCSVYGVPVSSEHPLIKAVPNWEEHYRLNYSDSTQKKAYFGFECEVFDEVLVPRIQFVHAVDNGSSEYQQLRALGYECLYDEGTGEPPRLIQNFVESGEAYKALVRLIDPALAQQEGWQSATPA